MISCHPFLRSAAMLFDCQNVGHDYAHQPYSLGYPEKGRSVGSFGSKRL